MYIFRRHNLGVTLAILLVAAVIACQGETLPLGSPPTLSPAPTMTSRPTLQPRLSPADIIQTPSILTPPSEAPSLCGERVEEQARQALAHWLGVSSEEIEVVEVEEVEWPDTSLGCPQPGMVYAQVIVPGWRVVSQVSGKVYEYHSGGGHGVLCDQEGHLISTLPSPTVTPITVPEDISDVCPMMLVAPHGRVCPTPRMPDD